MTVEEAIKILEKQKATGYYQGPRYEALSLNKAIGMAVAALRAQEKTDK